MITFKNFFRMLKGNRIYYIGAIIMTGLSVLMSMIPPLIIKATVDSILGGIPLEAPAFVNDLIEAVGGMSTLSANIWICSLAIVAVTALNGVASYFKGRWTAVGSENIAKTLKDTLYDHLQRLPYDYHVKAQTGDLIQRCTSDVDTIRRFIAGQMVEAAKIVFIFIFSVSIMISMNMSLTFVTIAIIPFIFIFSLIFFKKITASFKLADVKEGELQTVLQENLSGVRVVRAFGRQRLEVDKFEEKNSSFRDLSIASIGNMAVFWGVSDLLCMAQIGLVLLLGIRDTLAGEMSLGSLLVFNTYAAMLIYPMRQLARIIGDMGRMGVSIGRVYEIINEKLEEDTPGAGEHPLDGDIVFENVNFSYEQSSPVLKDLSFEVKAGETIAVLGSTGSGKSSLMHLFLRLYDYQSGSLKIGGVELRDISKRWLRENIGLVLQEPFLYSKTVIENLRMAKFDADNEEIFDAAKTAAVHDVIKSFEHGYETIVGEKGVTLSGGQKQRVAIARTLIKNSSILIFDDSLSAVDAETDSRIRAALRERRAGVTTFIISQRINTLMEADRIFVMEQGRLSDSGTHKELIGRDGLYSRIWNIQSLDEELES
ncbi:MAG: ABC transporter ATP-binding protein/permease [Clostridiales bacterium]|nr:ABC transporter ATP-binding protein/permease [Clostridiales bacterium]